MGQRFFTADDLLCAAAEIMGKSTYGTVYKSTLKDGNQVAVKRLREKISKGQKEFENEVDVLARGPDTPIDWQTRMQRAQGMTRGLFYPHDNENIIHGNLVSSNVLLDEHKNAKIADYGLSRLMTAAANTNVIATAEALGYQAPELSKLKIAKTQKQMCTALECTLELLTGKSPGEPMNGVDLPQRIASIVKEEWTNEVFDLELMKDASIIGDKLLTTLKLALHCGDPSPPTRPEVQQVLSNWKRLDQRQL
ncbi:hypothetical protein Peur_006157 [Populus x canadensis]